MLKWTPRSTLHHNYKSCYKKTSCRKFDFKFYNHPSRSRKLCYHFWILRPQFCWKRHQTPYFIASTSKDISINKLWQKKCILITVMYVWQSWHMSRDSVKMMSHMSKCVKTCKVMESIIHDSVLTISLYLSSNNLLCDNQHGFTKSRSILTNLPLLYVTGSLLAKCHWALPWRKRLSCQVCDRLCLWQIRLCSTT